MYLNILRAFAIISVVALHSYGNFLIEAQHYGTRTWYILNAATSLFRTGVPLFFMISGYLLLSSDKSKNIKEFYKGKLPKLAILIIIFNIFYYLFDKYLGVGVPFKEFISRVFNMGYKYHMWFVYVMLGIYLLTPFIKRIIDNCKIGEIILFEFVILLVPTIIAFINTCLELQIKLFNPLVDGYFAYFVLGYILGKLDIKFFQRIILYAFGIIGFVLAIYGNIWASSGGEMNLIFNGGNALPHYLSAAAIFVLFKNFKKETLFTKCTDCIAKVSFGIYWIHVAVIDYMNANIHIDSITPLQWSGIRFIFAFVISMVLAGIYSCLINFLRKKEENHA